MVDSQLCPDPHGLGERWEELSDWSRQFTTSHLCHVCGKESVAVEDEGWVCADHRNLDAETSSDEREGAGESIPSSG